MLLNPYRVVWGTYVRILKWPFENHAFGTLQGYLMRRLEDRANARRRYWQEVQISYSYTLIVRSKPPWSIYR